MKSFAFAAVLAAAVVAVATPASARPRPSRGQRFEANKLFGAGLELGAPTGITAKYFMQPDQALQFGLGGIDYYGDRRGVNAYGDYLWHPVSLVSTPDFELPLYFGIGARIYDFDNHANNDSGLAIGARVPVGVAMDFTNVPVDVFLQMAFVLDVFVDYGPGGIGDDLEVSIGARYWFE